MKKEKAFTLIELIVVLVILAVVALIVTPIILNILKNTEAGARKNNVDGYGKAIEIAFNSYELSYGTTTTNIDQLDVKYTGDKVICDETIIRNNGEVYLSKCSVNGIVVKDDETEDGYYHYGISNQEYIKKYALALEDQISEYLKNDLEVPEISLLTNQYSDKVSCNIAELKYENNVYLSECSVYGIETFDKTTTDGYYHYDELQQYKVGDIVKYNDDHFYVIENSDKNQDYVVLLKAEPLTAKEVNKYGIDKNGVNHVNKYTYNTIGKAYTRNDNDDNYGGMAYYTSSSCGYVNGSYRSYGCTVDYNQSDIKYVVDAWALDTINLSNLKSIDGYSSRLITIDELNKLGCSSSNCKSSIYKWLYNSSYKFSVNADGTLSGTASIDGYWTMSRNQSNSYEIKIVSGSDGYIANIYYYYYYYNVRPVINLRKSAIKD